MNPMHRLAELHLALGRLLDKMQAVALLAARLYVADVFIRSGWLKLTTWSSTLDLFQSEYHVPLLPPEAAAMAATFGELFFPALLVIGLFTRVAAIATFVVNAVAVISYSNVLLAEGFEAALGNHVLWGVLLLALMLFGAGGVSVDSWLTRRAALSRSIPATASAQPGV